MKTQKTIGTILVATSFIPMSMVDGSFGFLFGIIGLAMLAIGAYVGKFFFWQKGGEK